MSAGTVRYDRGRREYVAQMEFGESELNDLAYAFGPNDGFFDECMKLASELHTLNHPEDDE